MKNRHAFTLIELMVVIAIIGIVTAMVVNMVGTAEFKKRQAQVEAEKQKLVLQIENYHSKLNYYPPDNGALATFGVVTSANSNLYDMDTMSNSLPYELAGATMTNIGGTLYVISFDSNQVPSTLYSNVFGRSAVANSNPDEPHSFYIPSLKEYTNFPGITPIPPPVNGLVVPVALGVTATGAQLTNFWHYDASSPNRHNSSSYDLWAVYISTSKGGVNVLATNGNW